jgi:hypothetical protein
VDIDTEYNLHCGIKYFRKNRVSRGVFQQSGVLSDSSRRPRVPSRSEDPAVVRTSIRDWHGPAIDSRRPQIPITNPSDP